MIDWVDFLAPLEHNEGQGSPFYAGEVMSTTPDGELDWGIYKRMQMLGSHASTIQIRSARMRDDRQAIRVSGNLVKWFQGHNVFGTSDIRSLVPAALEKICEIGGLQPTPEELTSWRIGDIDLHRTDCTQSVSFGTEQRCLNALRSLDQTSNMKFRGRGQFNGHSLLFGKGSRTWSLTLYSKATEMRKHKLPSGLADTPIQAFADGLLRIEFRILSMHLKELGLDKLWAWCENTDSTVHQMMLQNLQISDATMIDSDIIESLPTRYKLIYQSWRDGHDLRTILTRPTFYRHRRALLSHGVDIAIKQDRNEPEKSNVVPIRVVLVGKPVNVPEWAYNTPMYYQPPSVFPALAAAA
jgi:II/X family phage/plasmid replication protein